MVGAYMCIFVIEERRYDELDSVLTWITSLFFRHLFVCLFIISVFFQSEKLMQQQPKNKQRSKFLHHLAALSNCYFTTAVFFGMSPSQLFQLFVICRLEMSEGVKHFLCNISVLYCLNGEACVVCMPVRTCICPYM